MKKNKVVNKLVTMVIAILFLTNTMTFALASDNTSEKYIEYTEQIYMNNIDIAIVDNEKITFTVKPNTNIFKIANAKRDISKLESFFETHPITESNIISFLHTNDLCAIGYTDTPLTIQDGHFERISAVSPNIKSANGAAVIKGNFTLTTSIMRTGSANSAGEYLYTAMTSGEWSNGSIFGGSNSPASGEDYVIQTTCNNFVLDEHAMITLYGEDNYGTEGKDSYPSGGGENYIQYNIKDDPFGIRQLKSFLLISNYYGPASNYTRSIHSAYTHTWRTLSISVSVNANIDTELNPEVGISITPSLNNKSWNLFSNVTFRF